MVTTYCEGKIEVEFDPPITLKVEEQSTLINRVHELIYKFSVWSYFFDTASIVVGNNVILSLRTGDFRSQVYEDPYITVWAAYNPLLDVADNLLIHHIKETHGSRPAGAVHIAYPIQTSKKCK